MVLIAPMLLMHTGVLDQNTPLETWLPPVESLFLIGLFQTMHQNYPLADFEYFSAIVVNIHRERMPPIAGRGGLGA